MKKIKLEFTKEQFLELMRLTFIGEMVINGDKLCRDFNTSAESFKDFIIKQAVKYGIKDYIEYYKGSKNYDYSLDKGGDFFELLEQSHEAYFYQELVEILARNIIDERYTETEIKNMDSESGEKNFTKIVDEIESEIDKNSYDNLRFKNINPLFVKL